MPVFVGADVVHQALSIFEFLIVACILQGLSSTQNKDARYPREQWQGSVRHLKHNVYEGFLLPACP